LVDSLGRKDRFVCVHCAKTHYDNYLRPDWKLLEEDQLN
jgi:hypothetical protein